jgi:hypothetical protein
MNAYFDDYDTQVQCDELTEPLELDEWIETLIVSTDKGKIVRYDCVKGVSLNEYKHVVFNPKGEKIATIHYFMKALLKVWFNEFGLNEPPLVF